ncbi:MAG: alpha/beta hydrolase [Gemmatimonadaceae bacterium]|nr:alpha/beta hydrolase [Gemmatimonadaceae bacterium]
MPPVPPPRAEGFTTSTEVPLYWCRHGDPSRPALHVLHGGPGASHDYLLPQLLMLAELGRGFELVFHDQRGGGRSKTDAPAPVTVDMHVADCAAVQRELGIVGAPIAGYSWGALLALHVAVAAAQGAHDLVVPPWMLLVSPAPYLPDDRARFDAEFQRRQLSPAIAALRAELHASGLRERDPAAHRQRAFELSVAGYFADPAKARDLTPFRVTGRVQQSTWASVDGPALLAALPSLRVPAIVVHGDADPIPAASAQATAGAIGARYVELAGCGHVPYVEQPTALRDALAAFLHSLPH